MQDIYTILSSIPNNEHYLQRYCNFISQCRDIEHVGYTENHHICPSAKTMFPLYKKSDWNIVKLSARQHFIAHWMLWKAYKNPAMSWAFMIFKKSPKQCKQRYTKFTSRTFELLRESLAIHMSKFNRGRKQSPEQILKRVLKNTGKIRPISAILATATANKGKHYQTQDTKDKQSNIMKLRPKSICPYCTKECDPLNFKRWHGDNCKFKVVE